MKIPVKQFLFKSFKIGGITIGSILLLLYLLPILFPAAIDEKIKSWTNKSIDGEINFSKTRLSFFSHFPSFTLSLYDFSLKGSAPFSRDTLVAAEQIAFGINLKSLLFDKKVNIDKIFLANAYIHVQVNEKGAASYNVYVADKKKQQSVTNSTGTALRLEKISITGSHLIYNDASTSVLADARGFNYEGNGDLSKDIFDLYSHAGIDSLDFYFDGAPYLKNKKVNADLITKINTSSLSILFEKNKLRINKLPVEFNGRFDFLKNGYDLDFTASSASSELQDFVTALPPQYVSWQKNASIKGVTDLFMTLKGQYIASTNQMPDLAFDMKIRNGYIKYAVAPFPASNIHLNLQTKMPSLNTDSLQVKIDSVFFNVDKDYFSAVINTKGITNPWVDARIHASLDLEKFDKAFGFENVALKGKCTINFTANGKYATGANPGSIRHEPCILSIPSYKLEAGVQDGYFKYASLPLAVSNIAFNVKSSCPDSDYRHAGGSISNIAAVALNNFIKGNVSVDNIQHMQVDAGLQSSINLADIKNIYPIKNVDVKGMLKFLITAKGKYDAAAHKFPLTVADVQLNNGSIQTNYYPHPISNIQLSAKAVNTAGTLKSQEVLIEPASFLFEGKTVTIKAALKNFENIAYDVQANGEVDVAKIYKVFHRQGTSVTGLVKASLHLQGKQQDALNKNYAALNNEGILEVKNIAATSVYMPRPFIIKEGQFKFHQDKMWFNHFKALYGQSDISMDGYLQNAVEYVVSPGAVLKGSFNLQSKYFNADEWRVYAGEANSNKNADSSIAATGVIIIPADLDVAITARAKKVFFNGLNIDHAQGAVSIRKGSLLLKQTTFNFIGSSTAIDAGYSSNSLRKASFDFKIVSKDFDVKRAYDSIKLFRSMATAAGKAKGIVSLTYNLKGKLDENMQPIYPSLQGGGVLSVKKVSVKGFKLFSAVSRKTGKDSIANPDVTKVDIKSSIKNNLLTLQRFKIKMAGFRLRMEGQTSLDGKLNLKLRLGLPPLSIIGIPMRITGTQDKPVIKPGKKSEDLTETEYKEEDN